MVVLVTGIKQSGKSTFAKELEKYGFVHLQFSEKLKKMAEHIIQMIFDDLAIIGGLLYDKKTLEEIIEVDWECGEFKNTIIPSKYNEKGLTFRGFLQNFGTDFVREYINNDYWKDSLYSCIGNTSKNYAVVSDLRFLNEIKDDENIIVVGIDRGYDLSDNHASEIEIPEIIRKKANIIVDSNIPLDEYKKKCIDIIENEILGSSK